MKRRSFLTMATAALATPTLHSCKPRVSSGSSGGNRTLTILTWADYLAPDIRDMAAGRLGCAIEIATFDSNETLLTKLAAGATYDLLVPSSYTVELLRRQGKLRKLGHSLIPNLGNMDGEYLKKSSDPAMDYSVPYLMAPTCVGYLATKAPEAEDSWSIFNRDDLAGHATMLDDMREVLGAALKSLGCSLNSTSEAELAEAGRVARKWASNLSAFENEQYRPGLTVEDYYLVQGYAGDLMRAAEDNDAVRIFIPREGTSFSCDDLCIPVGAENPDLAHAFINLMADGEISATNMETLGYRAPNQAAYLHLSEDFKGSPVLFPSSERFALCEPIRDLGDKAALWAAEWGGVKDARQPRDH